MGAGRGRPRSDRRASLFAVKGLLSEEGFQLIHLTAPAFTSRLTKWKQVHGSEVLMTERGVTRISELLFMAEPRLVGGRGGRFSYEVRGLLILVDSALPGAVGILAKFTQQSATPLDYKKVPHRKLLLADQRGCALFWSATARPRFVTAPRRDGCFEKASIYAPL